MTPPVLSYCPTSARSPPWLAHQFPQVADQHLAWNAPATGNSRPRAEPLAPSTLAPPRTTLGACQKQWVQEEADAAMAVGILDPASVLRCGCRQYRNRSTHCFGHLPRRRPIQSTPPNYPVQQEHVSVGTPVTPNRSSRWQKGEVGRAGKHEVGSSFFFDLDLVLILFFLRSIVFAAPFFLRSSICFIFSSDLAFASPWLMLTFFIHGVLRIQNIPLKNNYSMS